MIYCIVAIIICMILSVISGAIEDSKYGGNNGFIGMLFTCTIGIYGITVILTKGM